MNRKERRAAEKRSAGLQNSNNGDGRNCLVIANFMAQARRYYEAGQAVKAEEVCETILAREPKHVHSLNLLGIIAQNSSRHRFAVKNFAKALDSDPLNAACHYNIASSYQALDQADQAVIHFNKAIALGMSHKSIEDIILQNPLVMTCVARIEEKWPLPVKTDSLFGASGIETIAKDVFLRCAFESVVVCGVALERFLTHLRAAMLQLADELILQVNDNDRTISLWCAVARQCFINEYVFAQGDEETQRATRLKNLLIQKLAEGGAIRPLLLAAVSAYYPLHSLSNARAMLDRDWPRVIVDLIRQQIREPFEELQDHGSIPVLTAVENDVSLQVMRQYEQNPYPRWTAHPLAVQSGDPETLSEYAANAGASGSMDILIAGCGSGQQAFHTAHSFPSARVLAVDISLPSLAYARRKTREQGLTNIEYAQADILKLGTIGRTFDRIEAVGVLHHLAVPETGWRVLLDLLRPGGEMFIGLYSETARRSIVEAQALIAQRGYRPTIEDIRKCRQEILQESDKRNWDFVTKSADFYCTSGCRDMLFNVMEHRFTIPEIMEFLDTHRLTFLGFNFDPQTVERFQKQFHVDAAITDLNHWHIFESDNPLAFRHMYMFTVRKA